MKRLILITGTGRSGTSTMSGMLHHLGLAVPGPYLGANDSNPKGFFESKWAVRFHKRFIKAARLHDMDGRPWAFELAQAQIRDRDRQRLVTFLRDRSTDVDAVVVKDPRTVWAQEVWRSAAAEAGLAIAYVTMLRHPAEVIGSRSTYYASSLEAKKRRNYEIFNLVRWINHSLISERETRTHPRAFVRYTDLLTDWRPVATRLATQFDLTYDVDLEPGVATPVDEFIDPDLRRLRVTWDDLDVPADLRDLAEDIWAALNLLADSDGENDHASQAMSAYQQRFEQVYDDAAAVAYDVIAEARTLGELAGAEQARFVPATPSLDEVSGRELLKTAAVRALGRVRGIYAK